MAIIKHGKTLNKAKVFSNEILPKGRCIPDVSINPVEIAIHNTGNWDVPSNNYHRALKNANQDQASRQASWHFAVDDKEIYQHIDTCKKAWHVGNGNSKAIGIEICMFKDATRQKLAEDNAIALVRELMRIHNIPISKVKMHRDYTGKICPQVIIERDGDLEKFKKRIANYKQQDANTKNYPPNGDIQRKGKVLVNSLNVRSGRGTNYPIIGKLSKDLIIDLFYCMNGWSSMESKFKGENNQAVVNYICLGTDVEQYVEIL